MNCKVCSSECDRISVAYGSSHYERCPQCKLTYLVDGNVYMQMPIIVTTTSDVELGESRVTGITVTDDLKTKVYYEEED